MDSEFWHGKDWETKLQERIKRGDNADYWEKKILRNIERDLQVNAELNGLGWKVLRFWGVEINKNIEECLLAVDEAVQDAILNE